jgi:orotate phosphoribosyltransferase
MTDSAFGGNMNPSELLDVLEKRDVIIRGHFRLSSGQHSDLFVRKSRLFEEPRLAQRLGRQIAEQFTAAFDVVAIATVSAIALGFSVALAAEARWVLIQRQDGRLTLQNGSWMQPHERVLAVEEVITPGASAGEMVDLIRAHNAVPVGVGALIDRSGPGDSRLLGAPIQALLRLQETVWDSANCPLCKEREPLTDQKADRSSQS